MTTTTEQQPRSGARAVFERVLVGVDGSDESVEATRQAAVLSQGPLTLLAAYDLAPPIIGGTGTVTPAYFDDDVLRQAAEDALLHVQRELPELHGATVRIARGTAWGELLREVERRGDTLVAVGTRGHGRATGILLASTPTELLHKAPCSVLVAREATAAFPKHIVVGVDGSPESRAAYSVATHLADAHGAELWPVVAHGGKGVHTKEVASIVGYRREDSPDEPVRALVAAAADADLVVVGSRGLHGFKSLGSVSERVAHQAGCSVLVVRGS